MTEKLSAPVWVPARVVLIPAGVLAFPAEVPARVHVRVPVVVTVWWRIGRKKGKADKRRHH